MLGEIGNKSGFWGTPYSSAVGLFLCLVVPAIFRVFGNDDIKQVMGGVWWLAPVLMATWSVVDSFISKSQDRKESENILNLSKEVAEKSFKIAKKYQENTDMQRRKDDYFEDILSEVYPKIFSTRKTRVTFYRLHPGENEFTFDKTDVDSFALQAIAGNSGGSTPMTKMLSVDKSIYSENTKDKTHKKYKKSCQAYELVSDAVREERRVIPDTRKRKFFGLGPLVYKDMFEKNDRYRSIARVPVMCTYKASPQRPPYGLLVADSPTKNYFNKKNLVWLEHIGSMLELAEKDMENSSPENQSNSQSKFVVKLKKVKI